MQTKLFFSSSWFILLQGHWKNISFFLFIFSLVLNVEALYNCYHEDVLKCFTWLICISPAKMHISPLTDWHGFWSFTPSDALAECVPQSVVLAVQWNLNFSLHRYQQQALMWFFLICCLWLRMNIEIHCLNFPFWTSFPSCALLYFPLGRGFKLVIMSHPFAHLMLPFLIDFPLVYSMWS